jgi:NADH-quinone oxidoreductase subunit N
MTLENFALMRHELLLTAAGLLILIAEIFWKPETKKSVSTFTVILFSVITIIGFLPSPHGTLFGGMYEATGIRLIMKNILNIGTLLVLIQSVTWLNKPENSEKISEYIILLISSLIGMDFMISAGHFLMFYLGLELATIPVAALAAYDRYNNKSAEAGIKFILISSLSSGVLLYGLSMIYGSTGTLYFSEITNSYGNSGLQILGFILFFTGMAFKISIVPFHLWTADVYEGSPVNITSYLSVVSKGAAIFIFAIVLFIVFPVLTINWQKTIFVTSILTMTIGNLFAIRQHNFKRFLAFSSISQAGYIILGLIGGTQTGMASVVYYILVYIFSNLAAFGVVAAIRGREGIDDYNGL